MADYYPLLSRAIAGLAGKPDADRHAIYNRAREALERQLRGFEPSIGEVGIQAELDGLEATIARIEAEQATPPAAVETLMPVEMPTPVAEAMIDSPPAEPPLVELPPAPTITGPSPFKAIRPTVDDLPPKEMSLTQTNTSPEDTVSAGPASDTAEMPDAAALDARVPEDVSQVEPAEENLPPEEAAALQPMLRPRMPSRREEDQAGKKKPLALFAGITVVAMLVMGLVAMSRRDAPGGVTVPPVVVAADSGPDASKTEGRIANAQTPAKPAEQKEPTPAPTPQPKPEEAPRAATPVPETRPATPPAAAVIPAGNRAFMVLEVPGGAPNQFEGKTTWSFVPDPALKGQKALRALIDFPTGGLAVDLSIARNTDASVGFSHTVMVIFDPKNVENIREMSAIEWRERESQAGTVLAGIVVPVQDNVFMLGLDKTDAALARNLDLLRTQKWMVFEIRLVNGRRGAVLVEKGGTGDKAIADALTDWK